MVDQRTERFILHHLDELMDHVDGTDRVLHAFDTYVRANGSTEDLQEKSSTAQNPSRWLLDALSPPSYQSQTMGGRTRADVIDRILRKRQQLGTRDNVMRALMCLKQWGEIQTTLDTDQVFTRLHELVPENATAVHDHLQQWAQSVEAVTSMGVAKQNIMLNPSLLRDYNYYTGMVFELRTTNGDLLGAGGRYDELVQLMGSQTSVPAVGFAYYMDDILDHTTYSPRLDKQVVRFLFPEHMHHVHVMHWVNALREHGLPCTLTPHAEDMLVQPRLDVRMINAETIIFADKTFHYTNLPSLIAAIQETQHS